MEPAEDPEEEPSLAETDAIDGAHGTPKDSEVSRLSFNGWAAGPCLVNSTLCCKHCLRQITCCLCRGTINFLIIMLKGMQRQA